MTEQQKKEIIGKVSACGYSCKFITDDEDNWSRWIVLSDRSEPTPLVRYEFRDSIDGWKKLESFLMAH